MFMDTALVTDIDLWSDEALLDPYPLWRRMRDMGPVVLLEKYGFYALPRYAETRSALADWRTFSSARGVMLNPAINKAQAGATLHTDPPVHDRQRKVVGRPLSRRSLDGMTEVFRDASEELVDRMPVGERFDAVTGLAEYLPMSIVSKLVGLPEKGRERMLVWAAAAFDAAGPMNARAERALTVLDEAITYSYDPELRGRLRPDGWAAGLWAAADAGDIAPEQCPALTIDYWGPALDTTIAAIGSAIWLFGNHPDQWRILRKDPALLTHAVNEVVRLETPTPYFSRVVTRDVDIDGTTIPEGARVLMMYGSANRDERQWGNADEFDIRRAPVDQIGFGYGRHVCVGQRLARMEMEALLGALMKKVEAFEIITMERMTNNMLRQIEYLEIALR